jgi:hypothetical protein|tara:strand:- start:51519 stop:52085 length:567 start_codon:yes stop_codon:yes gene_type:complete
MMGILEGDRAGSSDSDLDTAHVILEKLGDRAIDVVTPARVVFASILAFLISSASIFMVIWIIPYDNVDMDVAYMQSASGHVVLAELDNKGSRAIEEVSVTIRLLDSDGIEVGRHDFYMDELPAHSSISNTPSDDLELIVKGESVWNHYTIEIYLEYRHYAGSNSEVWTHEVGDWTREIFLEEAPSRLF